MNNVFLMVTINLIVLIITQTVYVFGRTNRSNKKGDPIIGDCVWIGTNTVVVGNITTCNNVLIAPISHVNFNVPENAVIAGNPASQNNFI